MEHFKDTDDEIIVAPKALDKTTIHTRGRWKLWYQRKVKEKLNMMEKYSIGLYELTIGKLKNSYLI